MELLVVPHPRTFRAGNKTESLPSASTALPFHSQEVQGSEKGSHRTPTFPAASHLGPPPENHRRQLSGMVPAKGSRKFWLRNTSSLTICRTEAEAFFSLSHFNYDSIGDSLAFFPRAR